MTVNHAVKMLARRGVEFRCDDNGHNRTFQADVNGQRLTISVQGEDVCSMHVAPIDAVEDILTDYFPGSYYTTLPQVLRAVGLATP